MKGLVQLLTFLNTNWTFIVIIIGLLLMLYKKIKSYLKLSNEEKINAALLAIKNTIVGKMADEQIEWHGIKDAGSIKRAKVIAKIYEEYPILKNYIHQEELLKKIDDIINEALKEVKQVADNAIEQSKVTVDTSKTSEETIEENKNNG